MVKNCPKCGSELEHKFDVTITTDEEFRRKGYEPSANWWVCTNPECGEIWKESAKTGELYDPFKGKRLTT